MRFLFVCVENSCRSQMAEGFARSLGVEAASAGSRPSGVVNPKAVRSMAEIGIDLDSHQSLSVDEVVNGTYDAVVLMGCGDACPTVNAGRVIEWDIPDPKHMDPAEFAVVRDRIQAEVRALIDATSRAAHDPA